MKQFSNYLAEGLSSVVYHTTYFESAIEMLKNNRALLTSDVGIDYEAIHNPRKKFYYLSLSRTPGNSYAKKRPEVTFVLDGRKLSYKYSGRAIEYFGTDYPEEKWRAERDEMEDRLYTDEPTIESFSQYISVVNICLDDHLQPKTFRDRVESLMALCVQRNIPFKVYRTVKDFLSSNISKPMTDTEVNAYLQTEFEDRPGYVTDRGRNVADKDAMFQLAALIELWEKTSSESLSKAAGNLRYDLLYAPRSARERVKWVADSLRYLAQNTALIDLMKRMNVRTIEDCVAKLSTKWIKIDQDEGIAIQRELENRRALKASSQQA